MAEDLLPMKLLVLGNYGVGKSTLIKRFIEGTFEDSYKRTTSVEVTKIDGVNATVWDVPGDRNTVDPSVFQGAGAAIICFSTTDHESAVDAQEWKELLDKHVTLPSNAIIIAQTKYDTNGTDQAAISDEDSASIAELYDGMMFKTSAQTGDGVEELFGEAGERCVSSPEAANPPPHGTDVVEDKEEEKEEEVSPVVGDREQAEDPQLEMESTVEVEEKEDTPHKETSDEYAAREAAEAILAGDHCDPEAEEEAAPVASTEPVEVPMSPEAPQAEDATVGSPDSDDGQVPEAEKEEEEEQRPSEKSKPKLTYYQFPGSQPCRAIQLFMGKNEISHESINMEVKTVDILKGESQGEEITALNPFQNVPFLLIEGQEEALIEGGAIIRYLSAISGDADVPSEPVANALMNEALLMHDSMLRNITRKWLHPLFPKMTGTMTRADAEDALASSQEDMTWVLNWINNRLEKTNGFISGESICLADYLLAAELTQWAPLSEVLPESLQLKNYPSIFRFLQAITDLPGYSAFMAPLAIVKKLMAAPWASEEAQKLQKEIEEDSLEACYERAQALIRKMTDGELTSAQDLAGVTPVYKKLKASEPTSEEQAEIVRELEAGLQSLLEKIQESEAAEQEMQNGDDEPRLVDGSDEEQVELAENGEAPEEKESSDEEEEEEVDDDAAVMAAASSSMAADGIIDAVKYAHEEQTDLLNQVESTISDIGPMIQEELGNLNSNIQVALNQKATKATEDLQSGLETLEKKVADFSETLWVEKQKPLIEEGLAENKVHVASMLEMLQGTLQEESDRHQQETMQNFQQITNGNTRFHSEVSKRFGMLEEQQVSICQTLQVLSANVDEILQYKKTEEANKEAEWKRLVELREARHQQLPGSGVKMRIIVTVEDTAEVPSRTDLMVVAYNNDFVSDVIASTLRRAMASRILPENLHPSQCNLYNEAVLLFAEDSLDDLHVKEGAKLVLKTGIQAPAPAVAKLTPYEQMQRIANGVDQPTAVPPPQVSSPTTTEYQASAVASATTSGQHHQPSVIAAAQKQVDSSILRLDKTPDHVQERVDKRIANSLAFNQELADIVLEEDMARRFNDREELERRLLQENERMERDPILAMEKRTRVTVAKKDLHELRARIVDRATYSQNEVHRTAARGLLEKMNRVLEDPLVTVEAMNDIRRTTNLAMKELEGSSGEDSRVDMMKDAIKTEEKRKDDAIEDIKELVHVIEHRVRIPDNLFGRAESLVSRANSAIILAAAMSRDEVQAIRGEMDEFVTSLQRK